MSPIWGVLFIITAALALPAPLEQICTRNSECSSNFCCLLGPSRYAIPTCMPFQQEGEMCRVSADFISTNLTYPDNSRLEVRDINFILCPCANGLSCDPERGICN